MSISKLQRKGHAAHHNHLGSDKDPEHGVHNVSSLQQYRVSGVSIDCSVRNTVPSRTELGTDRILTERPFRHKTLTSLFLYDVFDSQFFLDQLNGSLFTAPFTITTWWLAFMLITGLTLNPNPHYLPSPLPPQSCPDFTPRLHFPRTARPCRLATD